MTRSMDGLVRDLRFALRGFRRVPARCLAIVLLGVVGALATSHLLTALLFEVSPSEPSAFAAAAGLLLAVVLVAGYGPARRASRVDPIEALRAE